MRHIDAIDLHLGAILEIVQEHVPPGTTRKLLSDGAFRAVNEMHTRIARPITRAFPDLDIDLRTGKRKSGPKPYRPG